MDLRFLFFVTVLSALVLSSTKAQECSGSAAYTVTVNYNWQQENETEEAQYPDNAHFSPMLCAVSKTPTLFVIDSTASEGFKQLAELGSESTLQEELENDDDVVQVKRLDSTDIGTSTGTFTTVLNVEPEASYVACVSMIAPSPDWVVGWTSWNACNSTTGTFETGGERDLRAYDAGTDSGATYLADDAATDPRGVIERATEGVIESYGTISLRSGDSSESSESGSSSNNNTEGEGDDESEGDDENECFPADATVELRSGNVISIDKLQVGDHVKVADGLYSPVFMFTHRLENTASTFVKLTTESGLSITLSKGHYLYADGLLQAADTISVGARLHVTGEKIDPVIMAEYVSGTGLYNPQTVHGDIIVNGVRASTYTKAVKPAVAHTLLSPFRFLYRAGLLRPIGSLFESGMSTFATLAPSGRDAELLEL